MISYIFVGFFLLLIRHFSRKCEKAQSSLCITAYCFFGALVARIRSGKAWMASESTRHED